MPFRLFAAKRRHAKRRNNIMRKDEETKPATPKDEISAGKDEKKWWPVCAISPFRLFVVK